VVFGSLHSGEHLAAGQEVRMPSELFGMPREAIAAAAADEVVPLHEISQRLLPRMATVAASTQREVVFPSR
jgi:chemotaxis response regulator CheB